MNNVWLNTYRRIFESPLKEKYSIINGIDTKEKLLAFQSEQLKRFLLHCYGHVPFYKDLFKRIGVVNNDKVDISKFKELPLLDKEMIRKNWGSLISDDYTTRKWHYNSSGGSTGEPLRFIQDDLYSAWGKAVNHYYYKNVLGVDEAAVKKVVIWGSQRDIYAGTVGLKAKLSNRLSNTIFLNSFVMTESDMENYVNVINSTKPTIVRGYAGSLFELSRYIERRKKDVFSPAIIVSSAETLSQEMRDKIERVFGTKVYNFYGSREVNNLAGECKEGLMHVFSFWNNAELLDSENSQVEDHEHGKVVVTSLFNYSMPLVRYELGDLAVRGTAKCPCGNMLPTFEEVSGRISSHFLKEDGSIIYTEYFPFLFYFKDWIKEFQVVQEDYKQIAIYAVLIGVVDESEKKDIEAKMRFVLGSDCRIAWHFVDELLRSKSGKHQYTWSMICTSETHPE